MHGNLCVGFRYALKHIQLLFLQFLKCRIIVVFSLNLFNKCYLKLFLSITEDETSFKYITINFEIILRIRNKNIFMNLFTSIQTWTILNLNKSKQNWGIVVLLLILKSVDAHLKLIWPYNYFPLIYIILSLVIITESVESCVE